MLRTNVRNHAKLLEDEQRSVDRLELAQKTLFRACDVAPVYICEDALAVLPKIFDLSFKPNYASDVFVQESDRYIEHLKGIKTVLQSIAKTDLDVISASMPPRTL
jgi:hypothetical protein